MSNKTLTARVKLDINQAERSLLRLEKLLQNINKVANKKTGKGSLDKQAERAVLQQEKLKQATLKTKLAEEKLSTQKQKTALATQKAAEHADKMAERCRKSANNANSLLNTVRKIAGVVASIQTIKVAIQASDTITSSENKLNNIKGGNAELTSQSMDKMYSAAQRSRSSYSDMMSNVSKTMILAGDSFQDNIDNAIRFQEIMAKAYTVGGASAQEMSTSMYQLVQALGAGILAGDELRSVREGAPLAYKKIEEYAQKVFKTKESLKDLASEGVITSDIIVAAIMNAEDEITKSFDNTKTTFAQTWDMIKNMVLKAFEPALQKLNEMLNNPKVASAMETLGNLLTMVGNALIWVIGVFASFFSWCADNWSWLQYVVIGVLSALLAYMIYYTVCSVISAAVRIAAWLAEHATMLGILGVIGLLAAGIVWLANTTVDGCEFMIKALMMVAAAILVIAVITQIWWLVWVAVAVAVVALLIMVAQQIIGAIYWIGAVAYNVGMGIANGAIGLWNSLKAIAQNIGIAFENGWIHAQNAFWSFIQSVLEGLRWLEPAINAVAEAFGKEGFTLSGVISDVSGKQKTTKSYTSVSDAWSSGASTYSYKNLSDAYHNGAQVGANLQDWIGSKGNAIKNALSNVSFNKLATGGSLPGSYDPSYALGDSYDPTGANNDIADGLKKLGNIDDNTGDMADSMDLTSEDLAYLRRIADMEWKKEFTTASITVQMTNNNTVNKEADLKSLAISLSELVEEEMYAVANGVYAN